MEQLDPCPPGSPMGKGPQVQAETGMWGGGGASHRVHGGLPLLQPFTCHWESPGRRGTLATVWQVQGTRRPSHSSQFQSSCSVPRGQRPMCCTTALPPGSRGLHTVTPPPLVTTLRPRPKLLARRLRLKGPPVRPSSAAEARDTQASASTSPSEATSLQASDALWPPGTRPGCSL